MCIVPPDFLEEHHDQTKIRSFAGDARPANSQDTRPRAYAWLGRHPTHSANLQWRARRQSGITLPSAAAAGTAWVDRLRVGRVRKQPAGEVLQADPIRAKTTGGRDRELAASLDRDRANPAGVLKGGTQ